MDTKNQNPTPNPSIISTGGGIVVRPENRELLRKLGFTVWLNVSINALLSAVSAPKHNRSQI